MEIISQQDYRTCLLFNHRITAMTGDEIPQNHQELELISLDISDGYDEVGGLTATLSDGSKMRVKYFGLVEDEQSDNVWVTLAEAGIIDVNPEIVREAIKVRERFTRAISEYKREMENLGMVETYDETMYPQEYVYCVPGLSRAFLKFPLA